MPVTSSARRTSRAVGLAVGLALLVPAAASATSVSVVRDGTYNFINAQGGEGHQTSISLQRAGAVIAASSDSWGTSVDVLAQPGDVITASVDGQQVFNQTFDGRPTLDASVCGNATSFSGLRSATSTVNQVGAYLPNSNATNYDPLAHAVGTVASTSGDTFSGTFDSAIGPDWTVAAGTEDVIDGVSYFSYNSRAVGACAPAVVPVIAPAPDSTAPTGYLAAGLPFRGGMAALLGGRAVSTVMVGEAGVTVTQALYLNDGAKLPARAAAKRKPTLLARGGAVSKHAGAVRLKLHATKKARTMRHKRTVRVAIVTTLRDRAGNVRRLKVKRVVLKRS